MICFPFLEVLRVYHTQNTQADLPSHPKNTFLGIYKKLSQDDNAEPLSKKNIKIKKVSLMKSVCHFAQEDLHKLTNFNLND